jgi:hypothetical protein
MSKPTHNIPDDCKPLIRDKGWQALEDNNLLMDIEPSDYCSRLYRSSFAVIYEQIPFIDEKSNDGDYTNIRDDEYGDTNTETIKTVLTRLNKDPEQVFYWSVFLHELETPNEKGLTKVLTSNADDFKVGSGKFAGFGWCDLGDADGANFAEWKESVKADLLRELIPLIYWLNKKAVSVKLRDADDGLLVMQYQGFKIKNGLDGKLLMSGAKAAQNHRNSSQLKQKQAELTSKTHIIPEHLKNLLSDEVREKLTARNTVIKIHEQADTNQLDVNFLNIENYDHIRDYRYIDAIFTKDPDQFNAEILSLINTYDNRHETEKAEIALYLKTANPTPTQA